MYSLISLVGGHDPTLAYSVLMRRYLRSHSGQVYFFTLVTHERRPILTSDMGRSALREAIWHVRQDHPFRITAIVLLPDHLHAVLELPDGDSDYSTRWRLIKSQFTRRWRETGGMEGDTSQSRQQKGERGVWQRRFYEHTCRDENDLKRCEINHERNIEARAKKRASVRPNTLQLGSLYTR